MARIRTDLDWRLTQAILRGNHDFVRDVARWRWDLRRAALAQDWSRYNECARALNANGADIQLITIPKTQELQMGMFDRPVYLTGDKGFVSAGDTFWLWNAKLDGTTRVNGREREQVKLLVSHERDSEKVVVFTSGAAVVNQVKRMDAGDRSKLPMEVRLDQVPSKEGNPANVMTPADQPSPDSATTATGVDDF